MSKDQAGAHKAWNQEQGQSYRGAYASCCHPRAATLTVGWVDVKFKKYSTPQGGMMKLSGTPS